MSSQSQPPGSADLQRSVETLSFLLTHARDELDDARNDLSNLRLSTDAQIRHLTHEIATHQSALDSANSLLDSKIGVISAVDRELGAAGIVHASRALGVKELAGQRDDLKRTLANRRELIFVDATPDAQLPVRILTAYIDEQSRTLSEPPALGQQMNRWQEERNAILRQSINDLAAGRAGRQLATDIEKHATDFAEKVSVGLQDLADTARRHWREATQATQSNGK